MCYVFIYFDNLMIISFQVHARTDCEYDVHGAQMRYSSM